jgi:hypothetical protein
VYDSDPEVCESPELMKCKFPENVRERLPSALTLRHADPKWGGIGVEDALQTLALCGRD